jgi:hypothetical protein
MARKGEIALFILLTIMQKLSIYYQHFFLQTGQRPAKSELQRAVQQPL